MKENTLAQTFKQLDIFAPTAEILFEHGKPKLKSYYGAILALIMTLTLILYGYWKATIMLDYQDNTIQEPSKPKHFGIDYVYGTQDGWRVAFGVTAYDSNSDPTPLNSSIGEIFACQKEWGQVDAQGNALPTACKPLRTEPCKQTDIDFDGTAAESSVKFYQPAEEFANDAKRFYSVLQCLVDEPVLMGDYNSAAAKQLVLGFQRCEGGVSNGCQSDAFIDNWMRRKFILTLENQKEFNKEKIQSKKITKSSRLVWHVLSPQVRVDVYNYIRLTELDLNDKIGSIGTDNEIYNLFITEQGPFRLYDYPDTVQLAITYELDRDLSIIRRKVYGFLDFLGDMGGLAGALKSLFTLAIILFQYRAATAYVANHTTVVKEGAEGDPAKNQSPAKVGDADTETGQKKDNLKRVHIGFFEGIKHSLQRLFDCCMCCHTRKDKLVQKANQMVKEELKIVHWVQFMRCTEAGMKKLLSAEEWAQIEKDNKFKVIELDDDEPVQPKKPESKESTSLTHIVQSEMDSSVTRQPLNSDQGRLANNSEIAQRTDNDSKPPESSFLTVDKEATRLVVDLKSTQLQPNQTQLDPSVNSLDKAVEDFVTPRVEDQKE